MINLIKTETIETELVPSEIIDNPGLKIFSADSMSLIIGPNGAGKSRALAEIANKIVSVNTNIEGENNPFSETFIIYYTPAPYSVDMPAESQQFVNLQRQNKSQDVDFSILQDLASFFQFSPQAILRLNSANSVFTEIYPFFSERGGISVESLPEDLLNSMNEAAQAQSKAERFRRENNIDYVAYVTSTEYQKISDAELFFNEKIIAYVLDKLGNTPWLKLVALLDTTKKHNSKRDILQAVLETCGVKFTRQIKRYPKTALNTFKESQNILENFRTILKVEDLRTNEYTLDGKQLVALQKLPYRQFSNISLKGLSAGGNALITQFSQIEAQLRRRKHRLKKFKNLLLLIDEGDIFLHLSWQQKYVQFLDKYISKIREKSVFETIQVILTTHSPVLMSDFPKDCIIKLDDSSQANPPDLSLENSNDDTPQEEIVSFGAPLQTIINKTGNSGTLGHFAADFMKKLVVAIQNGETISPYHIDLIDDPLIRTYLQSTTGSQ
jgi:hypothetical protein